MTLRWRISHPIRLIDSVKNEIDCIVSARFIKRALESNICSVNGHIERFGSVILKKGDVVELKPDWELFDSHRKETCSVIYEDDEIFVLNKPIKAVCTDNYFRELLNRPLFLAHRLDKDTTGVLLFGKSPSIAKELQDCFEKRSVQKEYLALVDKKMGAKQGVIENNLVKKGSFEGQTIWGSSYGGRGLYAKTSWSCLESVHHASLISCQIETGRTHQIRVHLSEMGHPIIIDRQYASHYSSSIVAFRPLLHASQLRVEWRQKAFHFQAPLANDFREVLKKNDFLYVEARI